MKQALRRITIKPNGTEVYMMEQEEYKVYEGYDEVQQHQPEEVHYGEQRRQQFTGQPRGYPPRGQPRGPQQQGYQNYQQGYQNYQGYPLQQNFNQGYQGGNQQRGNFRGQSNFRGYQNRPRDPLDTCYNALNTLTPQQQREIVAKLGQTYVSQLMSTAAAAQTNTQQPKSVFQVNNDNDVNLCCQLNKFTWQIKSKHQVWL